MYALNQLVISDERAVVGHYKSLKLTDPDAIYAEQQALFKIHKMYKIFGWLMFPFALLPAIPFFIMLFLGSFTTTLFLLTLCFGGMSWFWIAKERRAAKYIRSGTDKYCRELGVLL